jgi:hypothetical protein
MNPPALTKTAVVRRSIIALEENLDDNSNNNNDEQQKRVKETIIIKSRNVVKLVNTTITVDDVMITIKVVDSVMTGTSIKVVDDAMTVTTMVDDIMRVAVVDDNNNNVVQMTAMKSDCPHQKVKDE